LKPFGRRGFDLCGRAICFLQDEDPATGLGRSPWGGEKRTCPVFSFLVVLVQEDAPLGKGIIGSDHEHIAFPKGVVEKAFNDLLYALPR
jgi:hypothetical protein